MKQVQNSKHGSSSFRKAHGPHAKGKKASTASQIALIKKGQRTATQEQKAKQLRLLKTQESSYGGELLKKREGRAHGRPLSTTNTMHLVLRSSRAAGDWSFRRPKNEKKIREIVLRFSRKYGVRVLNLANVGNHLHFHIRLGNRYTYKPFIRAVTAAIMMAVTGYSKWNKRPADERFWDYRPFTRIIANGLRAFLSLNDYIRINQLEGFGFRREVARIIVADERRIFSSA